jgi:dTDP-6-deoxy-L-talose 4-dehydrogenase [NAD(P)+]
VALVLGGSGFVGRHVCAAYAAAGFGVVAAARRPYRPPSGVRPAVLDPGDAGALPALLARVRPAVVVNAAGTVWNLDEGSLRRSNVGFVASVIRGLLGESPQTPLIHLGSSVEYGPQPSQAAIREDATARPITAYGWSKLRATEMVLNACRDAGLRAAVLRLCTVIGPGQPEQSLLGQVAGELVRAGGRRSELVLGPLHNERDFVDVRDVADAVLGATSGEARGRVLNIGAGRAVTHRHLVRRLIAIAGVPATVVETQQAADTRSAGIAGQRLDVSAARALLGWSARRPLDETLHDLWRAARGTASSGLRGGYHPASEH